MKQFAALYRCLEDTTKTNHKIDCLRQYFQAVDPADAAWAVYFLSGRKPKRLLRTTELRQWCVEEANIPLWLFEECHEAVGDLAETIALLLPEPNASSDVPLHELVEERLLRLPQLEQSSQRTIVVHRLASDGSLPAIGLEQTPDWRVSSWGFANSRRPGTCSSGRSNGRNRLASAHGSLASVSRILSHADCKRDGGR